jgi:hypothetical protein
MLSKTHRSHEASGNVRAFEPLSDGRRVLLLPDSLEVVCRGQRSFDQHFVDVVTIDFPVPSRRSDDGKPFLHVGDERDRIVGSNEPEDLFSRGVAELALSA